MATPEHFVLGVLAVLILFIKGSYINEGFVLVLWGGIEDRFGLRL